MNEMGNKDSVKNRLMRNQKLRSSEFEQDPPANEKRECVVKR